MKVARHIIEARREAIAKLLSKVGYVPVLEICKQFNVSEATARRDLTELESQRRITRTHGGALSDFNRNFPPLARSRTPRPSERSATWPPPA
jgi:DeoR/GlpR family transcriptional regulator of sugar metabolism